MSGKILEMIYDVLTELQSRWPRGFSEAQKPNVISFLNFKFKKQAPNDIVRKRIINSVLFHEKRED